LFPAFGRTAIAVCANIREQLVVEMRLNTKHVVIIPNGIALPRYFPLSSHSDSEPTILFIGRLSGPKHQAVKRFIAEAMKDLLCRLPKAKFTVVGRMSDKEELEKEALPIWERFGRVSVSFLGYLDEVSPFLKLARLVMGSGRVVLEAMALGKPIVALGETDYLGVLTPDIFKSASESNFGDCSPREQINLAGAGKMLAEILVDEKRCSELGVWGREAVKAFDIGWVADQVEGVYRRCLSSPS
jgi:glycosyltransferase involved in cell wall biosynthesis